MTVEFRVLGDVTAVVDGAVTGIGHARQQSVLAVLLVEVNRPVTADTLIDRVWTGPLPRHPRITLAGYVSRLRQLVAIRRGPGGYTLVTDPDMVDLHRFRRLVAEARAAADDTAAARLFATALGLWRGEPFAALDTPWLDGVRAELEADRLAAELDRNDLALQRGEHAALLAGLARSSARYPLDERLAAQEMTALHRSSRSAAALERYARLRVTLADELGTDPGPALRDLHRSIVAGDPLPRPRPARVIPRQLPAAPRTFTGRASALARLDVLLERSSAAVISSVTGTAGGAGASAAAGAAARVPGLGFWPAWSAGRLSAGGFWNRRSAPTRVRPTVRRSWAIGGLSYVRTFHLDLDDPLPGSEQGEVEYAITGEQGHPYEHETVSR